MNAAVATPLSEREERVLSRITEEAWLALAVELVGIGQPAAENPLDPDLPGAQEEAIALHVAGQLQVLGFEVTRPTKTAGRPNVIGVWPGEEGGPVLIVNDHLDTYPAGDPAAWTRTGGQPFRATRDGDRLYGRGTSDTRGNVAAILLALKAIHAEGVRFPATLKAVFTSDEERHGTDGAIYLLDEFGLTADYEITVEPTAWTGPDGDWGMDIGVANAGNCLVEVTTTGVKTHLWRPDTGINALVKLADLIKRLETLAFTHTPPRLYGGTPPRVAVVRARGGMEGELQFTPDTASAILAIVGLVPGQTADSVLGDIRAAIAELKRADNSFDAEARLLPGSLFVPATEELPEDAEPALAVADAYRRVTGKAPRFYRKNAYNDTIRFAHKGINAVTFGPGEDGWPPVNEFIHISKAVAATKVLALAIIDILDKSKS